MSEHNDKSELEYCEELFEFLQGRPPEGTTVEDSHQPKLTPDQAWTVIWFLGNLYHQISDHVERCEVCGELYDTWNAGDCLDFGEAPYHFCDDCKDGSKYVEKMRLNPNEKERLEYFAR